ncbi:MAG: Nif3-like dinuclear metal center hexameric protein [Methanoculleaceae archaeon]
MDINDCIRQLEEIAPPELADPTDTGRIGLVVEGSPEVDVIACALDATLPVVEKAAEMGTDLLVVHHNPLYHPVGTVTGHTARLLRGALASDLNIYVMHTNFDRAPGGINDRLASLLQMENTERLPMGVVGDCTLTLPEISRQLGCGLRVIGSPELPGRLAVVGGGGFDPDLMDEAVRAGAGAYLSAELKHHIARNSPVPCIEATHYALEAPAMAALAERMGWIYIADPLREEFYY